MSIDTGTPQIVLLALIESQVETQHKPHTVAVSFHSKVIGSLERHHAYHTAYDSDKFTVDFEADYEPSGLAIIVERMGDG